MMSYMHRQMGLMQLEDLRKTWKQWELYLERANPTCFSHVLCTGFAHVYWLRGSIDIIQSIDVCIYIYIYLYIYIERENTICGYYFHLT